MARNGGYSTYCLIGVPDRTETLPSLRLVLLAAAFWRANESWILHPSFRTSCPQRLFDRRAQFIVAIQIFNCEFKFSPPIARCMWAPVAAILPLGK